MILCYVVRGLLPLADHLLLGEELPRPYFVHLLEIGHPLVFHETLLLSWAQDLVPTAMLPSVEAPCICRK
jgi:hypothetical protein